MDLHNLESPSYSRGAEKQGNRIALNVWDAGASTQSPRWVCRCQALVLVALELKLSPSKTSTRAGTVTQRTQHPLSARSTAAQAQGGQHTRTPDRSHRTVMNQPDYLFLMR
jgi:hypothetical protein